MAHDSLLAEPEDAPSGRGAREGEVTRAASRRLSQRRGARDDCSLSPRGKNGEPRNATTAPAPGSEVKDYTVRASDAARRASEGTAPGTGDTRPVRPDNRSRASSVAAWCIFE